MLNEADIKKAVLQALHEIAPEVDLTLLSPDIAIRDELEIDSMDYLRFMVKLNKALNVDIPEKDYAKLTTLNKCLEYINAKINK